MQVLTGETIRLRPIDQSDTEFIVRWRNNEAIRRFFIDNRPFTKESHEKWLETMVQTGIVDQFMIELLETGERLGSIYLRDISTQHKKAEYGIFIGEESARGKGIGTEAAGLILEYAFHTRKLHRVFLRVLANNPQAIRSYEKAGFVKEALLREDVFVNGQFTNLYIMGILADEYEKKYGHE